ncbi:hypothetical protein [Gloeobacter kilaueensis]|uniref:Uncharacterized protein n=1 Tax=Gloeobacter kilaueensis (strain ATCC BAA-2537 / CCAP 1431/1 / ULC 316 / JS1) TaxID=1183438 RepID=U5QBZ1_GLOK1|nr:hypothetical protein [Gloeobacter kilaueensis]AGY56361.1 hypothetical protein GKIL_0114 [Gloeobacter kilaueensis JS1]
MPDRIDRLYTPVPLAVGDRVRVVSLNPRFHGSALKDRRGIVTARFEPAEGLKWATLEVDLGDQYPRRYFLEPHLRRDTKGESP